MGLEMYHMNEIARALRLLAQGAAALTADTTGSEIVQHEPSPLFAPGQLVRLVDDLGQSEGHIVAERLSPQAVRLDEPVAGTFRVAEGARLQLATGIGAQLRWVAQGRPELMPHGRVGELPAVVVEPMALRQPPQAGTNRTYEQHYHFYVHYLRACGEGEEADWRLQEELAELFNLLMADPYLGETCWHAQVTEVLMRPPEEERLRAVAPGIQAARLEIVARRSELWPGGD